MKKQIVNASLLSLCVGLLLCINSFAMAGKLTPEERFFNQMMAQPSLNPIPASVEGQQRVLIAANIAYAGTQNLKAGQLATLLQSNTGAVIIHYPSSDTSYAWNVDHWVPESRSSFQFLGSTTNLISLSSQNWDADSNKWFNSFTETSTYDGNNRIDTTIAQSWYLGVWQNSHRISYKYDVNGYPDMMTSENWANNQWNLTNCQDYTYTGGLLRQTLYEHRTNNTWVTSYRTTYSYDGGNNLTNELDENFDGISTWTNSSQTINTYAGGKMTETKTQYWTGTDWSNSSRQTFTFNGSGYQTLSLFYYWLGTDWSATEADTSKYDGQNRPTENVNYYISSNSVDKEDFTYNGNGDMVLDLTVTKTGQAAFENSGKTIYAYGTATAVSEDHGILPISFALSQNFPNPFNPTTTIPYRLSKRSQVEISVYNVLGQEVKRLENGEQLAGFYHTTWNGTDASGRSVASGIYYYKIKTDDFTETRKMILLK